MFPEKISLRLSVCQQEKLVGEFRILKSNRNSQLKRHIIWSGFGALDEVIDVFDAAQLVIQGVNA